MLVKDITNHLEEIAPLALQESYDNAGLIIGNKNMELSGVLITLDITEKVIEEAVEKKLNLIIAHHPFIFSGLKKITGKNEIERCVIKAIKNDIAIYASHTNIDSVHGGVNTKICEKLGIQNCKVLSPVSGQLKKLVTFIPEEHLDKVRSEIFNAGAGHIGNYDSCAYTTSGEGSFRGNDKTNPYVGEKGQIHFEKEIRFETIFPAHIQSKVISALINSHPYEEVAFDIYALENKNEQIGIGMIGTIEKEVAELEFLQKIKNTFNCSIVKHTNLRNKK